MAAAAAAVAERDPNAVLALSRVAQLGMMSFMGSNLFV